MPAESSVSATRRITSIAVLALLVVVFVAIVSYHWQAISAYFVDDRSGTTRPRIAGVQEVVGAFDPMTVIPQPFPPITDVSIAPADDVIAENAEYHLADNELVLGIEVGGESRAYPINMLTGPQREIINDHLGGTAIAATW